MLGRLLIAAKPIPEAPAVTSPEPMPPAPIDVGPAKPVTVEISAVATGAGSDASILLVEDNLVNQKLVISLLRKNGYQLDVANNGQEALDLLSTKLYRLILMDIQMPVLDGLEATRRIRENSAWAGLPIVAMTAHAMNGDRERCLQAGMSEYLAKPVDHRRLLKLVEQYLAEGQPNSLPVAANDLAALDISIRAFGASVANDEQAARIL